MVTAVEGAVDGVGGDGGSANNTLKHEMLVQSRPAPSQLNTVGTHQPLLWGHHLSIRAPEGELYVHPHRYLDGVVEVDGEERDDAIGTLLQYYNSSEHSRRIEDRRG